MAIPVSSLHGKTIIALIVGNGFTHARTHRESVDFPSVLGTPDMTLTKSEYSDKVPTLTHKDTTWTWGHHVASSSALKRENMGSRKITKAGNVQLALAAIHELIGSSDYQPDYAVFTLPVEYFDRDKETMRDALAGEYHLIDSQNRDFTYRLGLDSVRVLPEGLPTVYDQIYGYDLAIKDQGLLGRSIGVVNVGTYTTDLIYMSADGADQLPKLRPNKCTSVDVGLSRAWSAIARWLKTNHGKTVSMTEADIITKQGFAMVGGKRVSVSNQRDDLFRVMAEQIHNAIDLQWDGGADCAVMIEAGGGGPQMHNFIAPPYLGSDLQIDYRNFGDIAAAASTEARGSLKIALLKAAATQSS